MRRRPLWASTVFSIVVASEALAGVGTWTSQGPEAGRMAAIVVVSGPTQAVFVLALYGGIFRSRDGGASWQAAHAGITYPAVEDFVQDPRWPGTLFAASYGGGVFKTVDYGVTWSVVNSGLTNLFVSAFELEPVNGTLYAGTDGGLFRSRDGGTSWTSVGSGLTFGPYRISSIAVHPVNPSIVYAAVSPGLFKSTDGGDSFMPSGTGIPSAVNLVRGDPANSSTVYAGTFADGLYKSTDAGVTWNPKNNGLTSKQVSAMVFDPTGPGRILLGLTPAFANEQGGLFRSFDSSESWIPVDTGVAPAPFLGCTAVTLDPVSPSSIYAALQTTGLRGHVRKSLDGGASWTPAESGLTGSLVSAVAAHPTDPNVAYASALSRLYRTSDRGRTWSRIGTLPSGPTAILIDPSNPLTIYAASFGQGIFKSSDGGVNWTTINTGLGSLGIRVLALDLSSTSKLFATTATGGVFKTIDGGASWETANVGLEGLEVFGLALDPTNGSVAYVGATQSSSLAGRGIYKTVNSGASWSRILDGAVPYFLAIHPARPSTIYAAGETGFGGMRKSVDGGANWTPAGAGLPAFYILSGLALDPQAPDTLYLLLYGAVFRSTDGASSWGSFSEGLLWASPGFSIAVSSGGNSLYLATYGGAADYRFPAASFFTVTPCRAVDTRSPAGPFAEPALDAGSERSFTLLGRCGISPTATSIAANLTVTGASEAGHLIAYQAGSPLPPMSTINYRAGQTRANNAILSLDATGRFALWPLQAGGTVQVIVDVSGYFE